MEGVPDLGEERIDLGAVAVVPAFALTLVTPVTALQHQSGTGLEFVPEGTFKFQRGFPIAGLHLGAQQLAAAEGCCFAHILQRQFAFGLRFVVAVVDGNYSVPIGEVLHVRDFFRQGFPALAAAPVGIDMVFHVCFDKMCSTVLGLCKLVKAFAQNGPHKSLSTRNAAQHP